MPLDHASVSAPEDKFRSVVEWYEKALAPLGYTKTHDFGVAVGFGDFWVGSNKATSVNEYTVHIAFKGKGTVI
jgi:lactoylglutathione lyase